MGELDASIALQMAATIWHILDRTCRLGSVFSKESNLACTGDEG